VVPKILNFLVGLKSSWIDFAIYDVPDITVWYNMLIILGRNVAKT